MARYQWIVLTCCEPGREREFEEWYDNRHLQDVCAVPGVVRATRHRVVNASMQEGQVPKWHSLAIYELETDGDPRELVAAIQSRAKTPLMPLTDALLKPGLTLVLGEQVASVTP